MSSFMITEMNAFSALTGPYFFTYLSIADEAAFEAILITNPGKLFLVKGTA